jgi:hypothetical protein
LFATVWCFKLVGGVVLSQHVDVIVAYLPCLAGSATPCLFLSSFGMVLYKSAQE